MDGRCGRVLPGIGRHGLAEGRNVAIEYRSAARTRKFASLADMAEEQKDVRLWGGVHYRFAIRTSEDVGRKVAAYVIENTLKPVR
jgi:hypothetical protein